MTPLCAAPLRAKVLLPYIALLQGSVDGLVQELLAPLALVFLLVIWKCTGLPGFLTKRRKDAILIT